MSELQSDSSLDGKVILFVSTVWSLVHLNVCWSNGLCLSSLSGSCTGERLCLVLTDPRAASLTPACIPYSHPNLRYLLDSNALAFSLSLNKATESCSSRELVLASYYFDCTSVFLYCLVNTS